MSRGKVQGMGSAGSVQPRAIFCPSGMLSPFARDCRPHAHKTAAEIETPPLHPGREGRHKDNRKWQLARYFRKVTPPVIFTRTFFGQNIATPDSKGVNGHLPRIGERGHQLGNAQRLSRPLRVCSVFDYLQNRALTLPRGGQAGGSWDT